MLGQTNLKDRLSVAFVALAFLLLVVVLAYYTHIPVSVSTALKPVDISRNIKVLKINETLQWTNATLQRASTTNTQQSYMFSLTYAEQLTNAFNHYNEFLSLVARGNFTGILPFVRQSRLYGLSTMQPGAHDIRLLMDMKTFEREYLHCLGRSENTTLIESMDSFLEKSYRKVLVVYFSKHMYVLPREVHKSLDWALGKVFTDDVPIVTCTNIANSSLVPAVEEALKKEQMKSNQSVSKDDPFTVKEVFCINPKAPLSLAQLMNHIQEYRDTEGANVSVLFISWQGKFTRKFSDLKSVQQCYRSYYSDKVKDLADQFIQSKGFKANDYISLHIRFEKLYEFAFLERHPNETAYYQCCMRKIKLLLEALSNKTKIPLSQTLFLADYGALQQGSDSCRMQGRWRKGDECLSQTNALLPQLPVNMTEFDPKKFKGASSWQGYSGFIAAVEQTSAMKGRVLVTAGRGAFQGQLAKRFISYHGDGQGLHYHVCIGDQLNDLTTNQQNC